MNTSFFKILIYTISHPKRVFRTFNIANLKKIFYYLKTSDFSTLKEKVVRQITRPYHDYPLPLQILPLFNYIKEIKEISFPVFAKSRVSIIIPVWNKWNYTYRCLQAILENTAVDIQYEIILVDNASTDETSEMLGHIKNIKVIANRENLGFVKGCNAGAVEAKGEYVLFLNNDTQVTTGWLEAMVELAEKDGSIGLVGAKLIYPDGRLQEAGGIVWNDPIDIAWNYGRYDNPHRWEYNYVKEVDYCSGACILVRKGLFERIGLFDKEFAPAYFEDTDLAFGVRKLGWKVMYQPKAVVIHFEGITAGTDTTKGMKTFQVVNQRKFYNKWHTVLEKEHLPNGKDVFLARDRSQGKRVMLFIDHYVPTYDRDAGSYITFEYLKVFLQMGYKIILWPDNLHKMEPYVSELEQMGIEVVYGSADFEKYIKDYGGYIDIACLARPHIAIRYIDQVKRHSNAKVIYVAHDLHFVREKRRAEAENNLALLKEAEKWKSKECYLMGKSDITLLFSDAEKIILEKEIPKVNTAVVPWIQPINGVGKSFEKRKDLIFIGGFAHMPNEDGMLWFVNEIFPNIKRQLPDINLIVLGSHPTKKILSLNSEDIIVTGFVKDVSDYFLNGRVFVAPLRYGAGFKGKIVQAMSYGLPVVTTGIGVEGMGLKDGENVLVADKPEGFADKVIELYANRELWCMLSQNSVKHLKENNSPEAAKKEFKKLFTEIGIHHNEVKNPYPGRLIR